MLYENLLLKTFNSKYNELIVKQELLRKNVATMIFCFYTNNKPAINYYIKEYMLNSGIHDSRVWDSYLQLVTTVPDETNQVGMFTDKTVKIMPKIHFNLVGKVLDLVCTIYNAGADRYLTDEAGNVNEDATKLLMEIYDGFDITKLIIDIYKQGYLFNTILVQPVWRNDKIELDIITPNFCSVDTYDNNYLKPRSIMINKSIDDEDVIMYWSDEEHYYIDGNNNKKPIINEEGNSNDMKNPFGELPFAVLRFNCSSDFWGEPQQDLIENNIWYDVREMNHYFVEMFQGLGVGLGINLGKNGMVSLSPNTMIQVDGVSVDEVEPRIDFVSTGAALPEIRDSLDYFYKRIGNSQGISSSAMSNDIREQSGVSKAYDSAELQIKKDSHKQIMKSFEKDLFQKIRLVNNYYSKNKLSDKLQFKVDIIEDEPMLNVSDEIAKDEFELQNNMISVVDLLIKKNPDLTTEEAINQLEENKKLNEKYNGKATQQKAAEGNGQPDAAGTSGV